MIRGIRRVRQPGSCASAMRSFHVLGIETSCDDSAVAVVNATTNEVVFEALASQWADHAPHGGIVPVLAARAHDRNLPVLLYELECEGMLEKIDAIAVTRGPGIKPCLRVGITAAERIARALKKPLMMVNHLQAHALVARLPCKSTPSSASSNESVAERPEYPFLSLIVSGGHSLLVLVEAYDTYTLLGSTLDDSVGEAFDKVARLLQLSERGPDQQSNISRHGGALVEEAATRSQDQVSLSYLYAGRW
mgnify:CR=1 FL=1